MITSWLFFVFPLVQLYSNVINIVLSYDPLPPHQWFSYRSLGLDSPGSGAPGHRRTSSPILPLRPATWVSHRMVSSLLGYSFLFPCLMEALSSAGSLFRLDKIEGCSDYVSGQKVPAQVLFRLLAQQASQNLSRLFPPWLDLLHRLSAAALAQEFCLLLVLFFWDSPPFSPPFLLLPSRTHSCPSAHCLFSQLSSPQWSEEPWNIYFCGLWGLTSMVSELVYIPLI